MGPELSTSLIVSSTWFKVVVSWETYQVGQCPFKVKRVK